MKGMKSRISCKRMKRRENQPSPSLVSCWPQPSVLPNTLPCERVRLEHQKILKSDVILLLVQFHSVMQYFREFIIRSGLSVSCYDQLLCEMLRCNPALGRKEATEVVGGSFGCPQVTSS